MYYYLFEASGGNEGEYNRAKSLIHLHGITGEMATPGPTAALEDLVTRAADKGYNTVVAVGGDKFITAVAKLLARSGLAFGVIPINASEGMLRLLGVKNLDQAITSLKQRHVVDTGLGVVSPGKVFLVDVVIAPAKPTAVVVESKTFRAEGTFTTLTIERRGVATVRFSDSSSGPNPLFRAAFWLVGRKLPDRSETVLRAPTLTISTGEPLPVTSGTDALAKTPCKVRVIPGALKMIQARSTISSDRQS